MLNNTYQKGRRETQQNSEQYLGTEETRRPEAAFLNCTAFKLGVQQKYWFYKYFINDLSCDSELWDAI